MRRCLMGVAIVGCLIGLAHGADLMAPAAGVKIAQGRSAIAKRNQATARVRAIHDALRKALEQVVVEILDPYMLVQGPPELETHLYARTLRYIRSYRVLWEYPDAAQKVYHVGIEAEVAAEEVAQEIQTLGLGQPGEAPGRLLVLVVEYQPGGHAPSSFSRDGGVVARVLRAQLQAQGFRTVGLVANAPWDGQASSALTTGKQAGASVVLVGQARIQKVRSEVAGMPLQAVRGVVQVRALTTATGKQLAQERAEATTFHADAVLGGTQALEKAAIQVAHRLAAPLRLYQQRYRGFSMPPQEVQ